MMDYTLIRSSRKTIAIYIRSDGIEVRAPKRMPKRDIEKFVASKEKWIADNLAKAAAQSKLRDAFMLTYGTRLLYRGKEYPIVTADGNRTGFDGAAFHLPPDLPPEQMKAAIVQLYRQLAKAHLCDRTRRLAQQMGVTPSAVKVSNAKKRWGSCSSRGNINLSWRLIMADDEVIDYVIVHELAHLTEMNHAKRFWTIVERTLPDYREHRQRLCELQQKLAAEDWGT